MLAHRQTEMLNAANIARGLGIAGRTVANYLDLLVDLLLVRRLPAWHLVLRFSDRALWAIEVKRGSAPKLQRGFHSACEDLKPRRQFLVYAGVERFSVGDRTEAIGVVALAEQLRAMR